MTLIEWNQRYLLRDRPADDFATCPTPLVKHWASQLAPGQALDLACGSGRNAFYLAECGWDVTAVDGAEAAIDSLRQGAAQRMLDIAAVVADLTSPEFSIKPAQWDLVTVCYYLQRALFPAIRHGLRPGGVVIAIIHIVEQGESATDTRADRGELRSYFEGWEILHDREGETADAAHRRSVAEIVVRRPK